MKAYSIVMKGILYAITKMNFNETSAFKKDCKKLQKKYLSLKDDIAEFKNIVTVVPLGNSKHFNVLTQVETVYIMKARLFCRYLKGSSMRIIYAYNEVEQNIEFIELYFKGDKESEDEERIGEYVKDLNQL